MGILQGMGFFTKICMGTGRIGPHRLPYFKCMIGGCVASQGQVSGYVLLDLSAAFDLVPPSILLKKLEIYGLEPDYLCWIQSYLTGRQQCVWIDHRASSFLHCEVGVPQGSNLGPLFFLLFVNDLSFNLECDMEQYADDSTLSATGSTIEEINDKLTYNC